MKAFGPAEEAVYQCLMDSDQGKRSVKEIGEEISPELRHQIDDALTVLSYHGVIDDSKPDEPKIAGTLFKDWYINHSPNYFTEEEISELSKELKPELSKLMKKNNSVKEEIQNVINILKKRNKNKITTTIQKLKDAGLNLGLSAAGSGIIELLKF